MTPAADLTPSGVSTSTVRRYLWPVDPDLIADHQRRQ
jgi:hypothetical protein